MNEGIHLDLDTWIVPGQIPARLVPAGNPPPQLPVGLLNIGLNPGPRARTVKPGPRHLRTRPDPGQNRLGPHKGIPSGEARQCTLAIRHMVPYIYCAKCGVNGVRVVQSVTKV